MSVCQLEFLLNTNKFKKTGLLFNSSISRVHSVTKQDFTIYMNQVEFSNYLKSLE